VADHQRQHDAGAQQELNAEGVVVLVVGVLELVENQENGRQRAGDEENLNY